MGLRRDEQTDELFRSILSLQNLDECYGYFEDLCTNKEVKDMSQRLTIAKLLEEGYSYLQAAEKLGVSSATIAPGMESIALEPMPSVSPGPSAWKSVMTLFSRVMVTLTGLDGPPWPVASPVKVPETPSEDAGAWEEHPARLRVSAAAVSIPNNFFIFPPNTC